MGIAGASRFVNAATLANSQGIGAQSPNILGEMGATGLLDVGRRVASSGLGISGRARALNQQFLNNASSINQMFSLGVGADATVEGLQKQILALRSSLPQSQIHSSITGEATAIDGEVEAEADANGDGGGVSASPLGQNVDTVI